MTSHTCRTSRTVCLHRSEEQTTPAHPLTIGSLCTGYGGLDLGAQLVYGGTLTWVSDIDRGANLILGHRWPDVPNLGNITELDWATVPPVTILTGGTPCQDLSNAGRLRGMSHGTRSNLWVAMREAIAVLRPRLVIWENVGGALSARADSDMEHQPGLLGERARRPVLRALGRVLGDLATLGYDAGWHCLRASEVGAPHGRLRVFILAWDADVPRVEGRRATRERTRERHPRTASSEPAGPEAVTLLPTPVADHQRGNPSPSTDYTSLPNIICSLPASTWGEYAEAIHRWEHVLGRPAPPPTVPNRNGRPQLSELFVEWMMGVPDGWVTDVPGMARYRAIKALGNGVVPQQAAAALTRIAAATRWATRPAYPPPFMVDTSDDGQPELPL